MISGIVPFPLLFCEGANVGTFPFKCVACKVFNLLTVAELIFCSSGKY